MDKSGPAAGWPSKIKNMDLGITRTAQPVIRMLAEKNQEIKLFILQCLQTHTLGLYLPTSLS